MHDKREREPIRYKIASSRAPLQRCVILEEMPTLTADPLEKEGFRFGQWLFGEASTPFLRGLITFIDEVELRKETGFGY
ncbi:hypothetical protein ES703_06702 [subsurface metagenome]